MNASVWILAICAAWMNTASSARADGVGNGGDGVAQEFYQVAGDVATWLENEGNALEVRIDVQAFSAMSKSAGVESTSEPLVLNGVPKDAINYPAAHRVVVQRERWSTLKTLRQKWNLVTHEMLFLIGQDDGDYRISGEVIRHAFPDALPGITLLHAPGLGRSAKWVGTQPSGKTLVHVTSFESASNYYTTRDFLIRLDRNGKVDRAFGGPPGDGTVEVMAPGIYSQNHASEFHLLSDGRIVAYVSRILQGRARELLGRMTEDGQMDPAFGEGGWKILSDRLDGSVSVCRDDGGLILGQSFNDLYLISFRPDGSLDASFGEGGRVQVPGFATQFGDGAPLAMTLQTDGKLLTAAGAKGVDRENQFAIARFNQDGSSDGTFGTGGKVMVPFPEFKAERLVVAHFVLSRSDGNTVAISNSGLIALLDPNGRLLKKAAIPRNSNTDAVIDARLDSSGRIVIMQKNEEILASRLTRLDSRLQIDSSFGDQGILTLGVDRVEAQGVLNANDGRYLVTGLSFACGPNPCLAVERLYANGLPDHTFGQ